MYVSFSGSLLFFQGYKERRDEGVCNNNVNYISSLKHWSGKPPENLKAFKYKDNDWPPYGNTKHPDYKLVVVLTVDSPGMELVEVWEIPKWNTHSFLAYNQNGTLPVFHWIPVHPCN